MCNNKPEASQRETHEKVQRTEAAKKEYKTQRKKLQKLKAKLQEKRAHINDKKKELENLSCEKGEPVNNLSELTSKLKTSEDVMAIIAKEILENEEGEIELTKQIEDSEHQLRIAKKSMEGCLRSLKKHIEYLEFEENFVLQEHGLGKTNRTPYRDEDYTGTGRVAGALLGVGTGALIGAGAAGAGGLLLGSLFLGNYAMCTQNPKY